jgi:energy-coupling factor transporter ATP-binding protein EcfA2
MLDKQTGGPYAIEVRGLTKHFGQRVAIEDLSMRVRYGQIQGLAGANGGGKSTSLRVLSGLLAPDSGSAISQGSHRRRCQRGNVASRPFRTRCIHVCSHRIPTETHLSDYHYRRPSIMPSTATRVVTLLMLLGLAACAATPGHVHRDKTVDEINNQSGLALQG